MDYLFLIMLVIILVILGLLPSFVWLCFFLRKDVHPEPKTMILKVFLYGMLSILPILIFVRFFQKIELMNDIKEFFALSIFLSAFYIFFWATTEEILKYLAVKIGGIFSHHEIDEPTDIILYMIIAGLGFAALENILILFGAHPLLALPDLLFLTFLRFISATIGHALWSGLIGYYIALSFFETKNRKRLFFTGLGIASFLHWFYNFAILEIGGILGALIIIAILIGLAIFVLSGFKKLKKLKSVCKI